MTKNVSTNSQWSTTTSATNISLDSFVYVDPSSDQRNWANPLRQPLQQQSVEERQQTRRMAERVTCLVCCVRRKTCGLEETCEFCAKNGWVCFRGHEAIWLWAAPVIEIHEGDHQHVNGVRKRALKSARKASFPASSNLLEDSLVDMQFNVSDRITIHTSSRVGGPELPTIKASTVGLQELITTYGNLQKVPVDSSALVVLERMLTSYVALHETNNPLRGLPFAQTKDDRNFIAAIGKLASLVAVLKGLLVADVHVRSGHIMLARNFSALLLASFAKLLAVRTEEFCELLVYRLRQGKGRNIETRYAIGLYHRVLSEIESMQTNSIARAILEDLQPMAVRAKAGVAKLFVFIQRVIGKGYGARNKNRRTLTADAMERRVDGTMPSRSPHESHEMALSEYLLEIVPTIPIVRPLHLALFPSVGMCRHGADLFASFPITMSNLLDPNGIENVRSRSDILAPFGTNVHHQHTNVSAVGGEAISALPTSLKPAPESCPSKRCGSEKASKSGEDTLVGTLADSATLLGDALQASNEPKVLEVTGEFGEPLSPSDKKLYTRIDRWYNEIVTGKRGRSSTSESSLSEFSVVPFPEVQPKTKRLPKKLHVESHLREISNLSVS